MEKIKLIVKGFIVGFGKIIPGVSGGMLAMMLKVYEPLIYAISHFFRDWKKNIVFLGLFGIGIISAIVVGSSIIEKALEKYYLPTMLLFIGLMLGGFSSLKKEVEGTNYKQYLMFLVLPIIFMIILETSSNSSIFLFDGTIKNYISIFLFGVVDAVTMIVPGISGTAILMLFGFYPLLLDTFSHLYDLSLLSTTLPIMIPFVLGIVIGAIVTIKIVSYLLEQNSIKFYYVIISFFISSIMLLFIQTLKQNYSVNNIIIGILFLFCGYIFSKKTEQLYKN